VIHLDTSFLIRALLPGSSQDQILRRWLGAGEPLGMSAIAWGEFLCGPIGASGIALAARIVDEPVPFVGADAALTAQLFNEGGRRRGSLVDCMIAGIALRAGAALATANPSDFRRYAPAGLEVVAG
jgi:predicted nucleic acid-binding protein